MSGWKKLAGASAGGDVVNVEDVFSTYVYSGNNSTQTITNGVDLANEGGMVWIKGRNNSDNSDHLFFDTERGATKWIRTNATSGTEITNTSTLTGFNSDGFDLGSYVYVNGNAGSSFPDKFVSWAFRKHPNFFNVKTFTTTYNVDPFTLTTGLDADLGMAWFRSLDNSTQGTKWTCWHRERQGYYTNIGSTTSWTNSDTDFAFNTSTQQFTFGYTMADAGSRLIAGNQEYTNYVGYFFAHNNNDGVFGPNRDEDIIKCGLYYGNQGTNEINVGFRVGYVLIKHVNANSPWLAYDLIRGMDTVGSLKLLPPYGNRDANEGDTIQSTANGFRLISNSYDTNALGNDYCYMAIRAGNKAPETSSDVFAIDTLGSNNASRYKWTSNFSVDFGIQKDTAGGTGYITHRANGYRFKQTTGSGTNGTDTRQVKDDMKSYYDGSGVDTSFYSWMWKRARGYFDEQGYIGNSQNARAIPHNLGVTPELIICSDISSGSKDYAVWHKDFDATQDQLVYLNYTNGLTTSSNVWGSTTPTATNFYVGANSMTNPNGPYMFAFLFATYSGISKVGSYEGTGSSQTIDCGFSNGAKFILIKNIDGTDDWHMFDTSRGISSGNDYKLDLNNTSAQGYNNWIQPASSGFGVTSNSEVNDNGKTFIFYAVAT